MSPTGPVISPQDHVEPVLLRRIQRAGPDRPAVLHGGRRAPAGRLGRRDDRPRSRDRRTVGRGRRIRRRRPTAPGAPSATWSGSSVIGPNAASSTTRRSCSAPTSGRSPASRATACTWSAARACRPAIVAPMGPTTGSCSAHRAAPTRSRRWSPTRSAPRAAIRAAAGVPDLDVEVLASMPLEFAAQLATRWREGSRVPRGRCRPPDAAVRRSRHEHRGRRRVQPRLEARQRRPRRRGPVAARLVRGGAAARRAAQRVARPGPLPGAGGGARPGARPAVTAVPKGTPDGLLEDMGYRYASDVVAASGRVPGRARVAADAVRARVDDRRRPATGSRSSPSAKGRRGDGPRGRSRHPAPSSGALRPWRRRWRSRRRSRAGRRDRRGRDRRGRLVRRGVRARSRVARSSSGPTATSSSVGPRRPPTGGAAIARAIALALGHARPSAARATAGVEPAAATVRRLEAARA